MSALTDKLVFQLRAAKLPAPVLEYRFARDLASPRQWRFDLCWPESMLAVEVEGGIFVQGRHGRGAGMLADMEKYNSALVNGWRVLRVAKQHIDSGMALDWITLAMEPQEIVKVAKLF